MVAPRYSPVCLNSNPVTSSLQPIVAQSCSSFRMDFTSNCTVMQIGAMNPSNQKSSSLSTKLSSDLHCVLTDFVNSSSSLSIAKLEISTFLVIRKSLPSYPFTCLMLGSEISFLKLCFDLLVRQSSCFVCCFLYCANCSLGETIVMLFNVLVMALFISIAVFVFVALVQGLSY